MCSLAEEEQQNYYLGDGNGDGNDDDEKFINMILVDLTNINTTEIGSPPTHFNRVTFWDPQTHYYGATLFRKSMSVAYLSTATATTV